MLHFYEIEAWRPASLGVATTDDLRPGFGLTLPPLAVAPVPEARSLSASARIFFAALISLSWCVLQLGQVQARTSSGISPI